MADILTPRQRAVWGLMKKWLFHKEIATRLGISTDTIRKHMVGIWDRMCFYKVEREEMLRELEEVKDV